MDKDNGMDNIKQELDWKKNQVHSRNENKYIN